MSLPSVVPRWSRLSTDPGPRGHSRTRFDHTRDRLSEMDGSLSTTLELSLGYRYSADFVIPERAKRTTEGF
jgi:hypothetical protein